MPSSSRLTTVEIILNGPFPMMLGKKYGLVARSSGVDDVLADIARELIPNRFHCSLPFGEFFTGKLQDLRRADRARRQDDFTPDIRNRRLTTGVVFDAGRPLALEQDPGGVRAADGKTLDLYDGARRACLLKLAGGCESGDAARVLLSTVPMYYEVKLCLLA